MKKYEFTGVTKEVGGITLRQIKRLSDGLIGGYVEAEKNLNHSGDAWVYGDAQVSGDARIYGDALVYGDARVYGDAQVSGDARVEKPLDCIIVGGLKHPVTIRSDGFMSIGCTTKTLADWVSMGEQVSKGSGYTTEEFQSIWSVLHPVVLAFAAHHKIAI